MKSILAATLFIAVLSLCNLSDKTKETNSNPANTNSAERQDQRRSSSSSSEPDRAAVLVELMKIEQDLTNASFNGDISTLASYMTDDYTGTAADGTTQTKNQLLSSIKPDKVTKSWKITDGELVSLSDDSAVLTYIQSQTLRNEQTYRARVTDTFVKKNGRWLIKSEQQTLIK